MQVDNQNTVEMLIKTKMDISQFERNLGTLERKLSVVQKELDASISKIGQSASKSSMAYDKATNARIAADKQAIQSNQRKLDQYKAEQAYLERQIVLAKQLSTSKASGFKGSAQAPQNGSPTAPQDMAKTSSWFQRLIGQHDELDKKMKQVGETSKNNFPHKVSTTAQYMAAGAGIAGVISALGGMVTAIVESDKAMGMFESVLSLNVKQAKELQQEIFNTGKTYGGTIADLNETTLALGRAGIKGTELVRSMKAVSQIALLSGEDLATVTDVFVSWKTVFPTADLDDLADSMVGVANATKIGISDIKTASNYLLTSGKQAGLTTDALLALSGAWAQIGKSSSTIGTEGRRFFEQLTAGSNEVKKAYKAAGINVDELTKRLAQGGPKAEQAMRDMFTKLSQLTGVEAQKILSSIGATLDRATLQSLIEMSRTGKDGLTLFSRVLEEAGSKANGMAKAQAERVSLTYEKMWERIKNSMTAGSSAFNDSFKEAIAGPGATLGSFNEKLIEFDSKFTSFMQSAGKLTAWFAKILIVAIDNSEMLVAAYATFKIGSFFTTAVEGSAALLGATKNLTKAQLAYNAVAMLNPYVLIATGVVAAGAAIYSAESDRSRVYEDRVSKNANTSFKRDYDEIKYLKVDEQRLRINEKISGLNKEIDKKAKRAETSASYKELVDTLVKERNFWKNYTPIQRIKAGIISKTITIADPSGLGMGDPKLRENDSEANKAKTIAKQNLDNKLAEIRLSESEYFLQKNITDQTAQKYYHVNTTLALEKKAIEAAGNYDNKLEDTLKKEREIKTGRIELNALRQKDTIEYNKQSVALDYQIKQAGLLGEKERINLESKQKQEEIEARYKLLLKDNASTGHAGLQREGELLTLKQKEIDFNKVVTAEKERQAVINSRLRDESIAMTSLQIKTANATTSKEQIALEQEMLRTKFINDQLAIKEKYKTLTDEGGKQQAAEIKNAELLLDLELRKVQGAESYVDLLNKSNIAYERNNSTAQKFMRVTEAGLQALDSGLMNFFDTGSEGFGRWSVLRDNLAQAIMKGLMQELVVNQMIQAVRTGMGGGSGGGLLGGLVTAGIGYFTGGGMEASASMGAGTYSGGLDSEYLGGHTTGRGFWAKGGVVSDGQPTYLAKGGYVNSIVKKPTYVAKGTIAGESGQEGVLPLQRDSQGRLGVINAGGSGETKNITVNIVNESGEKVEVTKSEAKTDMSGMVLDIWIDAMTRNKRGIRDMVRG